MTSAYTLKTPASTYVLAVADAKRHFRFDVTGEDTEITRYIAAATQWVQDYTGRSLLLETWQMSVSGWWSQLWLPRAAPLQAVTHVKYYDAAGVLQTLPSSAYFLPAFHEPAWLLLAPGYALPAVADRPDAVLIEYTTGAQNEAAVPPALVQAVALLTAFWFDHRSAVLLGTISKEIEFAVTALCAPWRLALREVA